MATEQAAISARPAAVAGFFYPADPSELAQHVANSLDRAGKLIPSSQETWPKAIIAPHAGYVYSGDIAARAYGELQPGQQTIKKVIIVGPAHRVAVRGVALPTVNHFTSPLGSIPLDRDGIARLAQEPDVEFSDDAHAQEHSLEVHLPFLQNLLGNDITILPLLVGAIEPSRLAELYEKIWGDTETAFVISSDLSHFLDYDAARRIDLDTCHAIEMLRPDLIKSEGACGRIPVKAMLLEARRRDLRTTTLDLRNSGDTAGSKDRVVGYGAWKFEDNLTAAMPDNARQELLMTSARALQMALQSNGRTPQVDVESFSFPLRSFRASFVTLEIEGRLRGCIGSLQAYRSLVEDVVENVIKAGFQDPRFPPLSEIEFPALNIGISVLGASAPISFSDEADLLARIRPGIDGLILSDGQNRGLFLPQVWDSLPKPVDFLQHLKQKAGLPMDHWSSSLKIDRFTVEKFATDVRDLPLQQE